MDEDRAIQEFISSVGSGGDAETARDYLEMTGWNVQGAVQAFIMDKEEDEREAEQEGTSGASAPAQASGSGLMGGRRLGDDSDPTPPQPSSATAPSSSSRPVRQQPKKKFGSLADLNPGGGGSGAGGADDGDSDKEQEFFTGGDKSGLAVQDPRSGDHIRRLMETARRNAPRPPRSDGAEEEPEQRSHFTGGGHTLGGDEVESQYLPAQNAGGGGRQGVPEMVERTLHLWADGFSVDDGQLYRYDDPANARTLELINSGSAPLDIMNVEAGQAVDVKLEAHRGEDYVQPKAKYKPFGSGGQRLGSHVPGASETSTNPASSAAATAAPSSAVPSSDSQSVNVDESQPTITLQIRLADGTRLPSRFNTTHTIGDVYDFVNHASPGEQRAYALATTFPTKELNDRTQVLGDMAEFKRGGVIVQKWT